MTVKNILALSLFLIGVWSLHGMDMQYYILGDNYLFDINLYMSLFAFFLMAAIALWGDDLSASAG